MIPLYTDTLYCHSIKLLIRLEISMEFVLLLTVKINIPTITIIVSHYYYYAEYAQSYSIHKVKLHDSGSPQSLCS